ncbi:MAG TPA: AsmA-like C-terminal region-containing protein, partial [Deltaproteobacteria bacterium]|nr:AsmA-like C-terminal region-containing protein [Deltaproteobacteria bacterium]
SGNSKLVLKGGGILPAYNLSGEWELRQAAYSFPFAVKKAPGMPSRLSFSAVLGRDATRITSLSYVLPPLNLSATALLKYGKRPNLDFELQTNQFMLNERLPILVDWQKYKPRGRVQAHVSASGNPQDFSAMHYNGNISLSGFSLLPGDKFKPISNLNGVISFKGNSVETSSISVLYGRSRVNVRGRIKNMRSPETELVLSSPQLFLEDLAIVSPVSGTSIRDMQGTFAFSDKGGRFSGFSGQFNNSRFMASGSLSGGQTPSATLDIKSSHLDIDDLLLLLKLDYKGAGEGGEKTDLKLKLTADKGNYGKMLFEDLNASMTRDDGVFYLTSLAAGLYDGTLSASGRVAEGAGQGHRYDVDFKLQEVDAEPLFKSLDITREIQGNLELSGKLTGRGSTLQEVKQTALGNLRLNLTDGSLKKFGVLSKLFSILNVSQLLKFQLPDMVTGGMPFDEITGTIAVRDGKGSSSDLFISSDAINISIIGTTDIVKEELDLTIGVQPLQTVDKIVNRIPVFGWLLTGKGDDFLTAYFEAKGAWADPQVKAVPVKSLAGGVLNVFRRAFELPVRLFTDTGEVILGE